MQDVQFFSCKDRLPPQRGQYCTSSIYGYEICFWTGSRWITPGGGGGQGRPRGHGGAILYWSESTTIPVKTNHVVSVSNDLSAPSVDPAPPVYHKDVVNSISVVVTGRNDNYDGNFNERLMTALRRNMQSLPGAEFIFVEWNPILRRKLLSVRIKNMFPEVRCFVVHPKFHRQYCIIDEFLEYPAKNVGIRRAKGEFILSTNSDIVLSPEVVHEMRFRELNKREFYRATRVDIQPDYLAVQFPLKQECILELMDGHVTNACGDFLFMHRDGWNELTGYCEEFPGQRLHKDSFAVHLLINDLKYSWKNLGQVTHWRHPSSWSVCHDASKVGDPNWDWKNAGYVKNKDTWGLTFARETERDGITWLL